MSKTSSKKATAPCITLDLCYTCLSTDRRLHPIVNLPELRHLCKGVSFSEEHRICYECKAMLNRILRFKQRAINAMSMLSSLGKNISKYSGQLKSLSSLTRSNACNTFDREFILYGDDHILQPLKFIEEEVNVHSSPTRTRPKTHPLLEGEPCPSSTVIGSDDIHKGKRTEDLDCEDGEETDSCCEEREMDVIHIDSQLEKPQSDVIQIDSQCEDLDTDCVIKVEIEEQEELSEPHIEDNSHHFEVEMPVSFLCQVVQPSNPAKDKKKYRETTLTETELLQFREEKRNEETYRGSTYKCETCILTFYKESLLEKHNALHKEDKGPHQCNICEERFSYQTSLVSHHEKHYTCYECCDCDFRHHTLKEIKTHVLNMHTEQRCKSCNTKFNGYLRLKEHRANDRRSRLECEICKKMLANNASYSKHMKIHKGDLPSAECDVCQKRFHSKSNLKFHMKRMHSDSGNETVYCETCDHTFRDRHAYRHHLSYSSKHVDAKYECADCGRRTVTKSEIRLHIESMHVKRPLYECETCQQRFITKSYMLRHVLSRHRRAPGRHVCHECGSKFKRLTSLRDHMNSHSGRRPHECAICGDTFAHRAALYTHNKRRHAGTTAEKKTTRKR
ncbi:zinc finger protein 28 isoform X1 [Plutella xylostella]|uniref:zinc finger protein 28 isoform X1 n=1 Tax=Plutella xylostella TaxID=51655 RepID=UPI002032696F|nr:zinc finger protein 28 isoform X1 [Plutella xylostella]